MIYRSLRLRCPNCGEGRVCRGWFAMHEECDVCQLDFRREPGFYLGSIYINYGLTAVMLTVVCGPLVMSGAVSHWWMTPIALAFCAGFPMWFLRYARCLWLGLDQMIDGEAAARRRAQFGEIAADPSTADGESLDSKRPSADEPATTKESASSAQMCPFCHTTSEFPAEYAGNWTRCPACDNKMLIT
ncbi:MAG: DUF983 domain-containing protein [Pirellulaceae bacterium]|nr:DUF983 domain-containing protein [Pirellulaceae bacterium]MDP7019884.1 DUF983 domain-containing protein [Pirellulaceae bacterium]